jgi:hypothetical protein
MYSTHSIAYSFDCILILSSNPGLNSYRFNMVFYIRRGFPKMAVLFSLKKNEYIFNIFQLCYMTCQSCKLSMSTSNLRKIFFVLFSLKMAVSFIFAFQSKRRLVRQQRITHVDLPQSRAATRRARWLSWSLWLRRSWCVPVLWLLGAFRRLYRLHNVTKMEDFLASNSETLKVRNLQSSSTSGEYIMVYVTKLFVCACQ